MRRWMPVCLVALPTLCVACSSEPEPPATIVISTGQEADAFTRLPVPDQLAIRSMTLDGTSTELARLAWPTETFDIGDLDLSQVIAFEASLEDSARQPLLRGQTVYYDPSYLYGYDVPVFVGRVGELSRPDGSLPVARIGGVVAVVGSQFVLAAGGSGVVDADGATAPSASASVYDLAAWNVVHTSLVLPRPPTALPIIYGEHALLINDDGATWFDFSTYDQAEATAPSGMTFADVSGGQVVFADDGTAYVVGATRTSAETDAVLRVGTDLSLELVRLHTPRRGASATWSTGHGLVVAGGSAAGAGVETLAVDASAFAELPTASSSVTGAGAVSLDDDRLLLVGGVDTTDDSPAPSRIVDLSCTSACTASPLDASPPVPMLGASVYLAAAHAVFVVGEVTDGDGSSRTAAYLLEGIDTTPTISEVPMKEPRGGAVSLALTGRTVGILGGYTTDGKPVRSVEVFVPR